MARGCFGCELRRCARFLNPTPLRVRMLGNTTAAQLALVACEAVCADDDSSHPGNLAHSAIFMVVAVAGVLSILLSLAVACVVLAFVLSRCAFRRSATCRALVHGCCPCIARYTESEKLVTGHRTVRRARQSAAAGVPDLEMDATEVGCYNAASATDNATEDELAADFQSVHARRA